MNRYKYKDLVYAQKTYSDGFLTKYRETELKLVALYMRDELGITKKQERKEALHKFCEKHLKDYHRMKYYKIINKVLDYSCSKKNYLINIDSVPVMKSETDYLNRQDISIDEKKVLFALLITYKLRKLYFEIKKPNEPYDNMYFKGGTSQYNDLKKVSNIHNKLDINIDIISELAVKGYVKIYSRGCIRLNFIEAIVDDTGEVAFEMTDYNNIGYWFEWYNGNKRIGKCAKCGNVFYKRVNNQIYCSDCQGYEKIGTKTLVCCDCGKEFEVDGVVKNKKRCDKCQDKLNKINKSNRNKLYYYKSKTNN